MARSVSVMMTFAYTQLSPPSTVWLFLCASLTGTLL
nr:MAG TPA: hypothetical protein [Caudoviricetes sp.]DAQ14504.1 MAG TPA: hypothetical protein [Caudoviricetes sp.]